MMPPAPPRLSTTTGCFHSSESARAVTREMRSSPPPGAAETTIVTGLRGKSCAETLAANRLEARATMIPKQHRIRFSVRVSPPGRGCYCFPTQAGTCVSLRADGPLEPAAAIPGGGVTKLVGVVHREHAVAVVVRPLDIAELCASLAVVFRDVGRHLGRILLLRRARREGQCKNQQHGLHSNTSGN